MPGSVEWSQCFTLYTQSARVGTSLSFLLSNFGVSRPVVILFPPGTQGAGKLLSHDEPPCGYVDGSNPCPEIITITPLLL